MERQAFFPKLTRAATTGVAVAALNFVCLWVFVHVFGPKVSFSLAFLIAVAAHFTLSKVWTFRDRSSEWGRQIWQYLIVATVSYLIQLAVFQSAMSFFGLYVFSANAVAIVVGTLIGFLLMHSWVFSNHQEPGSPQLARRERPGPTRPRPDPPG